ncbi:hypothetical protein O3M35_006772 [Rhynocoris fuscipes]|uniref:Uncharacterized protein n=1 Tax=Rhynocoris fuscipes TaxID=488301 RepID=A0AAW1DMA7_9HEMI
MFDWRWVLVIIMSTLPDRTVPLQEIRAAVILPQDSKYVISLPRVMPVLDLASSSVKHLLSDHYFNFIPSDDHCDADYALKNAVMVKMCPDKREKLDVMFGPTCEYGVGLICDLIVKVESNVKIIQFNPFRNYLIIISKQQLKGYPFPLDYLVTGTFSVAGLVYLKKNLIYIVALPQTVIPYSCEEKRP